MDCYITVGTLEVTLLFLWISSFYRRFIPNFSSVAAPLSSLTKKTSPSKVVWSQGCQEAFDSLRHSLCSSPVLQNPDFSHPFIVQTDASDIAAGAVLAQLDEDGYEHPTAYFSRNFLPREECYSPVEKECLAIKPALQAFKVYLLGRHFLIQTDHRALQWLSAHKDTNPRLTRWNYALQAYDFSIEHRLGRLNTNADALSR